MKKLTIVSTIGELTEAEALCAKAREATAAGADELHAVYKEESQLEIIKAVTAAVDTPLICEMTPKRFEDVKKVFYAGATKVILKDAPQEAEAEIKARFGSKIVEKDAYLIPAPKEGGSTQAGNAPEMKAVAESLGKALEEEKIQGILLEGDITSGALALKQALKALSFEVNLFESSIAFSEFKLNSDGMIPVIVQDYLTAQVLMLAYMNEEAFTKTIETGVMHYYSRSRQELWMKGETSGHFQYVKELAIDCDNDTLLAKVHQIGAACHTGNYSCFYRTLAKKEYNDTNPLTILKEDFDVIKERKENPREGSYTNYLFDKGVDKILKKVGEEATEIVIAAKNPDAEELKYEIADFLYHMMVLMVQCNLTWEDITAELKERR